MTFYWETFLTAKILSHNQTTFRCFAAKFFFQPRRGARHERMPSCGSKNIQPNRRLNRLLLDTAGLDAVIEQGKE